MDTPSADEASAALPPMALLATLQTATTVWQGVTERRTGRDPVAQESAEAARSYLEAAGEELTRLHMQLLMAKVQAASSAADTPPGGDKSDDHAAPPPTAQQSPGDGPEPSTSDGEAGASTPGPARLADTVRRFDMLMKLHRTDRLLHGAHQRLMSLYPDVSEELVEEARRCRGELSPLRDAPRRSSREEPFEERLAFFLQRLLSFAAWMQREL